MYFEPKKKKYERKTLKGRIIASKIAGFNSDRVVFYIKRNGAKQRFMALLKNNEEAKGYYLNYPKGTFVEITYLDTFFPIILKIGRVY